MISIIKIGLAVLLIICLFNMPYGYYQLVRFIALVAFSYFAYLAYTRDRPSEVYAFIGLAILFQPLVKISLGRTLWNIVDIVVAIGLIISTLKLRRRKLKT